MDKDKYIAYLERELKRTEALVDLSKDAKYIKRRLEVLILSWPKSLDSISKTWIREKGTLSRRIQKEFLRFAWRVERL